jgi:hypothetical protein
MPLPFPQADTFEPGQVQPALPIAWVSFDVLPAPPPVTFFTVSWTVSETQPITSLRV